MSAMVGALGFRFPSSDGLAGWRWRERVSSQRADIPQVAAEPRCCRDARLWTELPGTSQAAKLAFRVMGNHFLSEAVMAPKLDDEARTIDSETFDTR